MRRLRILHPLRERDFALFQTGSIVSLIGDALSGSQPEPMPAEREPAEVRV